MSHASGKAQTDEQDASMDTILASIRRIIMEDEAGQAPATAHAPADPADDELLVLQPSMIVGKKTGMTEHGFPNPETMPQNASDLAAALFDAPEPVLPRAISVESVPSSPVPLPVQAMPAPTPEPAAAPPPPPVAWPTPEPPVLPEPASEPLLAPAASQAAAQSLASLQDALRPEPPPPSGLRLLRSGGPTIEDMVREELRLQLKDWLDTNLPPLVERLVAQEIGRLVGRT